MPIIVRPAPARWLVLTALALVTAGCSDDDDNGTGNNPPDGGAVEGRVTADGAGVADAGIALSGTGTGTTTTGSDGRYQFDGLDAGSYTLTLTVPEGFELPAGETAAQDVTVTEGGTAIADWSLTDVGGGGGGGTVVEVRLSGTSFSPATVQISRGTTVRWIAQDGVHTVTPDNPAQSGAWNSTGLSAGQTFEHTFNTAGTFDYHCQPHQALGMVGSVVVQ